MPQYSIVKAPFLSFFSADLYRDVGRHWKGRAFAYLLVLLAICWLPLTVTTCRSWRHFRATTAPALLAQLPRITIENGKVSTDAVEPHYIKEPSSGGTIAIIDTTGHVTSLAGTDAKVLLTKTQVIAQNRTTETRVYELSSVHSFTVDRERVNHWLDVVGMWAALAGYPLSVLAAFIFRTCQALFYAVFGLIMNKAWPSRLDYSALVRLAIVSTTPSMVLTTALDMGGFTMPFRWVLTFGVSMAYLAFAIRANGTPVVDSGAPAI